MNLWRDLRLESRRMPGRFAVFIFLGLLSTSQLYAVLSKDRDLLPALRLISISSEPRPFTNRSREGGYRDSTIRFGLVDEQGATQWHVYDRTVRQKVALPHRAIVPYIKILFSSWAINPALVEIALRRLLCGEGLLLSALDIRQPVQQIIFTYGPPDGHHYRQEVACVR